MEAYICIFSNQIHSYFITKRKDGKTILTCDAKIKGDVTFFSAQPVWATAPNS